MPYTGGCGGMCEGEAAGWIC